MKLILPKTRCLAKFLDEMTPQANQQKQWELKMLTINCKVSNMELKQDAWKKSLSILLLETREIFLLWKAVGVHLYI